MGKKELSFGFSIFFTNNIRSRRNGSFIMCYLFYIFANFS